MPYINDDVFDSGLDAAGASANVLHITSTTNGEPATAANATAWSLANDSVSCTYSLDATSGTGRRMTVPAITSGTITATGQAGYWALISTTSTKLIAAGALSTDQTLASTANTFTLDAVHVIIRDPT